MKIEEIEILSVKTDKLFNHAYLKSKGWKNIANVIIKIGPVEIACNLVRGESKETKKIFYFFELPCFLYKDKKNIWRKLNLVNFSDKKDSEDFQNRVFSEFIKKRPDLFKNDLVNYNNSEKKT